MNLHSVTLDSEKCQGCTHCIKRCPTQAIRVRNGKAQIKTELCIDCGECIRVCPHHAKKAVYDPFDAVKAYTYTVALPAPALYGQFNNLNDIDYVLTALKMIGFDDVFEIASAAELVSEATRLLLQKQEIEKPIISSACPAIDRLIRVRFPDLCKNVLPFASPLEVGARLARKRAIKRTGLPDGEIGVFFISPCPAKVSDIKHPINSKTSAVNGALSVSEVYGKLVSAMNKIDAPQALSQAGMIGIGWARSGGESAALLNNSYLAADGIENVINVLEEVEDGKLNDLNFIELSACPGGCVGGVLTVENPYIAKTRIQLLRKYMPVSQNHLADGKIPEEIPCEVPLSPAHPLRLSEDLAESMQMMAQIEQLTNRLPGLDCGACGAPTCRALAEDVVRKNAVDTDCVFLLRERVRALAETFDALQIKES